MLPKWLKLLSAVSENENEDEIMLKWEHITCIDRIACDGTFIY